MLKLKTNHILEAVIVVLILSLLLYYTIPKTLQLQHRAQIAQLENAMQQIKQHFIDHPNDSRIVHDASIIIGDGWGGPFYDMLNKKVTLLYYKEDERKLDVDKLETFFPHIQFPDWTFSNLTLSGYAIYSKLDSKDTNVSGGYSGKPAYIAILATVGKHFDDSRSYPTGPYRVFIDKNGQLEFEVGITPFDPSNGMSSYGEFLVDTKDIWDATKAVLLENPPQGFRPMW